MISVSRGVDLSQNNSCVRESLSAAVKTLLDEVCFISSQPRPYQQDTSSNNLKVEGGKFRVFQGASEQQYLP